MPVTPGRRVGIPMDASAVIVAHRLLSFVMRSNDDSVWAVHSLMLSFHDLHGLPLRRPPSTLPCNMVFSMPAVSQGSDKIIVDLLDLPILNEAAFLQLCSFLSVAALRSTPSNSKKDRDILQSS